MTTLTYKYRLKDQRAAKHLRQYAIALNQVWNYCVAVQRNENARYRAGAPRRRWPTSFRLHSLTAGTSKDLGVHSGSVHEICSAFALCRDTHKRTPKFRASFGSKRALGWVPFRGSDRQIDGNTVTYLGRKFRFFGHKRRPIPDTATSGSFVEDSLGRWWVCFAVAVTSDRSERNGEVGIDLGLKSLAALSDGGVVENHTYYRQWQQRLATAQRAGNKRRARAIYAKISRCRHDHLHKSTTLIVRANALVVVGNVNGLQLAKTRMAKSVLDAGWSTFRHMLRYKASRHGVRFLEVDERFTTVTCSSCGARSGPKGQKGLRIREWKCSDCGACHDRDVNSARNILSIGRSAAPPVEESRNNDRIGTSTPA